MKKKQTKMMEKKPQVLGNQGTFWHCFHHYENSS